AQVPAARARLARPQRHDDDHGRQRDPAAPRRRAAGERGPPVIEQMSLRDLGVIAEATLPFGPGFTAVTGETGAGKTMVVTGLGLLLGARADSGAVRKGAGQASVAGVWLVPPQGPVADIVADAGGELEPAGDAAELYVSRTLTAEGRSQI